MKDYCDILRTNTPEDTLALEVLRWDTQEVLDGQLNGRPLEVAYNFGDTAPPDDIGDQGSPTEETASTYPANCSEATVSGYMTCWDDSGSIQVDVPDYWTDVNGGPWSFDDQEIGVAISAAPSLTDFSDYYDAEGMFFGASDTFAQIGGYVEFLDYYTEAYKGSCTLDGRFDYNDGLYRGKYDQYTDCGGAGGYDAYVLCAVDIEDPTSKIILIEVQVPPGDVDIINQISATFYVFF
jgi:serine protease Do